MIRLIIGLHLVALVFFFYHSPLQTPSAATTAQDVGCAGETGATFGLCKAYCEAMDCDSANPRASAGECDNVSGRFFEMTGRDLPCLSPRVGALDWGLYARPRICDEGGGNSIREVCYAGSLSGVGRPYRRMERVRGTRRV